ncbi:MAG: ribosome maturation factor RimP [Calditrichia bacterium]
MKEEIAKIRDLIQPLFQNTSMFLVDIELRGGRNNQVLSVYADTEAGITMEEITELTRNIEDVLDINDPIPGHYRLEVSSPGTNRPLIEPWQFRKNIGRNLRILFETEEGRKDYIGTLKSANENDIVLQLKKEEITIPLSQIVKAVVKLKW